MRQSSTQLTHPNLFRVWRYAVVQICRADKTWTAQMELIRMAAKSHGFFQNWFESFWCFALFSFSGIGAVHLTSFSSFRKAFRSFCSSEPIPSNQNKNWMLLLTWVNCIRRISSFLVSSIYPLTEATFINLSFHGYWLTLYYASASSFCLYISC